MSTTSHPLELPAPGSAGALAYGCWQASADPTGAMAAFVSDRHGIPQLWLGTAGSDEPRLLDASADPVSAVSWSPDGRWIGYAAAPGGGEHTVVRCVRPDGSGRHDVAGAGALAAASLGCWTRDGRDLAVTEALTAAPGPSDGPDDPSATPSARQGVLVARLVDPDGRRPDRRLAVETGSATLRVCDISGDGRWMLLRRGPRGHREAVVVETAGGRETALLPVADGDPWIGCFSPDARWLWLRSDEDRSFAALTAVELLPDGSHGEVRALAAQQGADLELFAADREGRRAVLSWNRHGRSTVQTAVLGAGGTLDDVRDVPLPHEVVTRADAGADGGCLLSLSASVRLPGVWTASRSGQVARTAWTASGPPFPGGTPSTGRPAGPQPPRLLEFEARDGTPLTGWFHAAGGSAQAGPCVVHLHGGPEGQERPVLDPLYQALLARGLHVFAPDVRGSAGHGRDFLAADLGAGRIGALDDVADCAAHLVAAGLADPRRLTVMGRSYGGYLVMSALTRHPDLFRAGVAVSGISDFSTFFAGTEPWTAQSAAVKYGHPVHDRDLLTMLSPMTHVAALRRPVLAVHGALDTNVPPGESEQFVAAARRLEVPAELLVFEDEGHELARRANRERLYRAAGDWLVRWTR